MNDVGKKLDFCFHLHTVLVWESLLAADAEAACSTAFKRELPIFSVYVTIMYSCFTLFMYECLRREAGDV